MDQSVPFDSLVPDDGVDFDNAESVRHALLSTLVRQVGIDPRKAQAGDWFTALAMVLRGWLSEQGLKTARTQFEEDAKRVYYLSMEFLTGRHLTKHLTDLGVRDTVEEALTALGLDVEAIINVEPDAALGNGGLGRLAACFLDSMATHGYPGYGYGIRYEFGMFSQTIEQGRQVEHPESWLQNGSPWEFLRPSVSYGVRFGGKVVTWRAQNGSEQSAWVDAEEVQAQAYDLKVTGYGGKATCNLRLWSARATTDFDLRYFNEGNYIEAVKDKTVSENLSKVLYPMDTTLMGQELRLKQEYFFVCASLEDILARFRRIHADLRLLPQKVAIQLNDTHPALAIPELMRLLMDKEGMEWSTAWEITRGTFAYTNHTLLPEALETWPIDMLEHWLPRHMEIIYRINHHFLQDVRRTWPGDAGAVQRMSIIDDGPRRVRMAHLAVIGSRKVNGVAALHTRLLRERVFPDFDRFFPGKFVNVTNGITQRRWLLASNPALAGLVSEAVGEGWTTDLSVLSGLEICAKDPDFQKRFQAVKAANKARAAQLILERAGVVVSPDALFDVQIKRIHEYKRQLLNLLQAIARYNRIRREPTAEIQSRVVVFGGKAAPGYHTAKTIIRLINEVAETVNHDPLVAGRLKIVFVPNYNVSAAEILIPGSDLSEQISTAGTEASGTGNMKFALNGALTIGTLDGANIEIREEVGEDNIFIFGHTAEQVSSLKSGGYDPNAWLAGDQELAAVIGMVRDGFFNMDDPERYQDLIDGILGAGDPYMLMADFRSYMEAQDRVDALYADQAAWTEQAVLNVARIGKFSSDRSIHTYARDIWEVDPLPV